MTKSKAAFLLSCEKLFDTYGQCYFWTFTFKECMPDWWYPRHWDIFIKTLTNLYGGWIQGVRVIEVHPGGHGLHYHCIIATRVSVHLVRRVGRRVGIGHVHVQKCDRKTAHYLAKYLDKGEKIHKRMKKWACMGGFCGVKWKDIEIESTYQRNMLQIFKGKRVTFRLASAVAARTKVFGPVKEWPEGMLSEMILSEGNAPINRPRITIERVRK